MRKVMNDPTQRTITNYFPVHKGPLKFDCKYVMTSAENQKLLKNYRRRPRKQPSVVRKIIDDDDDDVEYIKTETAPTYNESTENAKKKPISPNIILRTDIGYTKYFSSEESEANGKCWESVIFETSPLKKPKLQKDLTITMSQTQIKDKENNTSRTMQMTQTVLNFAEELPLPEAKETPFEDINITNHLNIELIEGNNDLHKIHNHVTLIEQIIENATESHLAGFLFQSDKNILKNFQQLSLYSKYISCKLFTHQVKWYSVCKFAESINLSINPVELKQMVNSLKEKLIVKADYSSELTISLLHLLSVKDVKDIHNSLRLKTKRPNKPTLIDAIIDYTNRQTTVDPTMSLDRRVRNLIYNKLGDMICINPEFYSAFYKAHLLYTFTNPEFTIPSGLYLRMQEIKYGNVVYPSYSCINEMIFENAEEFSEFYKAYSYKDEVLQAMEKKGEIKFNTVFNLGKEIIKEFTDVLGKVNTDTLSIKPKHLIRFTAGHKYASALSIVCKYIGAKWPNEVREWLETLLSQKYFYQKKRGLWYSHLSLIYNTHLKDPNKAVEILIEGLKDETVSHVDLSDLVYRARSYSKRKKMNTEELSVLMSSWEETIPNSDKFPTIVIKALGNNSSEAVRKGDYKYMDKNGDILYMNVEDIAIRHYIDEKGFTDGLHCEGALMRAMLFILFWDIIYSDKVAYSFVCKMQYIPLDFYTAEFYNNRKDEIDRRLCSIKSDWSSEYMESYIIQTSSLISNFNIISLPDRIMNGEKLHSIVNCIGRPAVSDICRRLIQNLGDYRAGMPDLFVFNENSCKFVEVKGPGDTLSPKQKLWIKFLLTVGVDAEVCLVDKIGNGPGRNAAKVLKK